MMCGATYRVLSDVYSRTDEKTRQVIIDALAKSTQALEPMMDMYGLGRDPEGVARGMILTEDLIGCEPAGELLSVNSNEAVRKVESCPWAHALSDNGETCRLMMAAMEEGIGKKYGLKISCEQNMAEGKNYCIWRVSKRP